MSTGPWEGGKGSRPRKYNVSKYLDNYERIFGNASKQKERQEGNKREHKDRDGGRKAPKASDSNSYVKGES
jgi:hypothetical protein